jgi:hypothetical protein
MGQVLLAATKFMPFHAVRAFQMRQAQIRPAVQPRRRLRFRRCLSSAARPSRRINHGEGAFSGWPSSLDPPSHARVARKGGYLAAANKTSRPRRSVDARPAGQLKGARDRRGKRLSMGKTDLIQSDSDKHFLHTSVLLRHASGDSGEAERQIETILTQAVVAKHRVWISSILFAELRPSTFVPGRFATLFELTRYLRSLATVVTPDPNTMTRAARLRDAKWRTPAGAPQADEKPRSMSLSDAIQVASALWVKEAIGIPDLEFLMFDERSSNEGGGGRRLSLLGLEEYAENADASPDHVAAVGSTRVEPVLPQRSTFRLGGNAL